MTWIIDNSKNIKESPGDLRRLDVTQTLVKKPSVNADGKNSKGENNNNNNNNNSNDNNNNKKKKKN